MSWILALGTSFWLGILTSISPCPLASNVAAISYLTREASRPRQMLFCGVLYSLGRSATYVTLGALIAASLLNVPSLAFFLQSKMNQILGPVLILAGIFLLGWFRIPLPGFAPGEGTVSRIRALGPIGAILLGMLFALSFCPVSAGLFFGSLVPLSLQQQSPFSLPLAYGVGTALPVLAAAFAISLGIRGWSEYLERASRMQEHLKTVTGWIFLLVGLYYVIAHFRGSGPLIG
mgnify:CR=1 FL=1